MSFPKIPTSQLGNLPLPVKILAAVLGGGSMMGVAYLAFGGNSKAMMIVALGIFFILLLLFLYKALLGWMRKRKASPLSQGLAGNAAAAPQGISEPARRARLDDLRRNFEQGCEKFRAAGKNLYSVPWYVLVGEPGSGKTEAIRHCNVGFPPGLQDQLQGAGGTLNMNWWFTNQAIILDTAGRLMFEEVQPGSTNEWAEFLKLLKNNRPNSPLNGMLLVIPVDTLIKDSADNIEKKAGKIAQQFDQIQRTLGVRFPVFVIITKCDLLNGFREFFDDLNDPQLQHQIMGWSNPAALDERFDPATVTNHLETVKQLVDRRSRLLLDPVNTEDPQSRRVDQVDALYALPDSIVKIGPRLRRYLEMIFVAGEWSPKPLFLRGIYFTSSMTEGSALDAELAEVLGVPVDSLPEGRVWRRDRAYFLRDLFIEKVFREKGLVTRASNADKQQSTRRAVVLLCGFFAVIFLFAVTYFGAKSLSKSIGGHRDFWTAVADFDPKQMRIVQANNAYYGDPDIGLGNKKVSLAELFGSNFELVKSDIQIPIIFKPMTVLSGNINSERRIAYRALYESTVLRPVYDATRKKIPSLADTWNPDAAGALAQLMKLEYAKASGGLPKDDPHPQVELKSMFRFVLSGADYDKFKGDQDALQKVADWIYTKPADGEKDWPAAGLAAGQPDSLDAIRQGIDATRAYWKKQTGGNSEALANLSKVKSDLDNFRKAESALRDLKANYQIDKAEVYREFRDHWNKAMADLRKAGADAVKDWAAASNGKADASLTALYSDEVKRITGAAQSAYDALLTYTLEPPATVDAATINESKKSLYAAYVQLTEAKKEVQKLATDDATQKAFAEFDADYIKNLKGLDNADHHRFEVQLQVYELADAAMIKSDDLPLPAGPLANAYAATDDDSGKATTAIQKLFVDKEDAKDRVSQAISMSVFTIDASGRYKKLLYSQSALKGMPDNAKAWPEAIKARAAAAGAGAASLLRPQVPMVTFASKTFEDHYAPDAAGNVVETLDAIRKLATPEAGGSAAAAPKVLDAAKLSAQVVAIRKGFDDYRTDYIRYWREDVKNDVQPNSKDFATFANDLNNAGEKTVRGALDEYGKRMIYALEKVGAAEDVTAVKLAAQLNASKAFQDECSEVLSHWRDLGENPQQVRRAVLGMDPGKFTDNLIVISAKNNDGFIGRYWQGFPRKALDVLANAGRDEVIAGLKELAGYERFPLAAMGDKANDLSQADVLKARTALERVRGSAASAAPAPGAVGARLIGQGGTIRDKEIDSILDRLRGTDLLRDKQDYFDKLDKFFLVLPFDDKPLSATLTVDKVKLKEDNSISYKFSYMVISQNGKALRESALGAAGTLDSAALEYAGGDVTLQFRDTPGAAFQQTETFSGPWAVFRLIKSPNVKSIKIDGTKWTLEYTVTSGGKPYALWLVLEFKQPLPDVKDWPVPAAK